MYCSDIYNFKLTYNNPFTSKSHSLEQMDEGYILPCEMGIWAYDGLLCNMQLEGI